MSELFFSWEIQQKLVDEKNAFTKLSHLISVRNFVRGASKWANVRACAHVYVYVVQLMAVNKTIYRFSITDNSHTTPQASPTQKPRVS